jgi:hypothetical protein
LRSAIQAKVARGIFRGSYSPAEVARFDASQAKRKAAKVKS